MEALVATVLLAGLVLAALIILARTWPRSSPFGGYRARQGPEADDPAALTEEHGRAEREDDEVRWHWPDDDRPPGAENG